MTDVPLLSIVLTPRTREDADRLATALQTLTSEDPSLQVRAGADTAETIVSGQSEVQLDQLVDRLAREFGVSATVRPPRVEYGERLTRTAEGEMKYAVSHDGIQQYGHVKLRLSPREPEAGNTIRNEVAGAIPAAFMPAIEQGIEDALQVGALAGYPVIDVTVIVYDGSYHDVDSSDVAFRKAAALACHDALRRAKPILVEPVMRIEVVVPHQQQRPVVADLLRRGGQLQLLEQHGSRSTIHAVVPLARMFGYLQTLTTGQPGVGSYLMTFHRYEPVRPSEDTDERGDGPGVRQPLAPRPAPRAGRMAVPLDEQ